MLCLLTLYTYVQIYRQTDTFSYLLPSPHRSFQTSLACKFLMQIYLWGYSDIGNPKRTDFQILIFHRYLSLHYSWSAWEGVYNGGPPIMPALHKLLSSILQEGQPSSTLLWCSAPKGKSGRWGGKGNSTIPLIKTLWVTSQFHSVILIKYYFIVNFSKIYQNLSIICRFDQRH